ncbi:conserved hypothetical protein [[Clostridium] saccharolyticum WM1]|uniref:MtfA protein n=1 Tax=Lacrimispora saccharolytica (strain ATCC 35040 / DSM 2544 / NRCC 2533 / WM1) TaxID=610130 RepID=D9R5H2_LACSW|nr:conserved hypothetical protein [[Clostridium] saccharolyticum WM1]
MGNIFKSVKINDTHMLNNLGLALSRVDCVQPPEPKINTQDIPGADGILDLTESLVGRTLYNNRIITMEFGRGLEKSAWPTMYSRVQSLFHGKQVKVIFDDDTEYYYSGRAAVSDYTRTQMLGTLVITVNADPYKYEMYGGLDDWLWDPFNFQTGIIRSYKNLTVSGTRDVRIIGRDKIIVPLIISNASMTVTFKGKIYNIVAGNNKIYDIEIMEGDNTLTFTGNGVISIDYRGGIL